MLKKTVVLEGILLGLPFVIRYPDESLDLSLPCIVVKRVVDLRGHVRVTQEHERQWECRSGVQEGLGCSLAGSGWCSF